MVKRLLWAAAAIALALLATPASAANTGLGAGLHPGRLSFLAPPPDIGFGIGPVVFPGPACKAGQIEAVAFTESSPDGVLGVVELKGTKFYRVKHVGYARCSLPIAKGPRSLLAADGTTLAVPRGQANPVNPAGDGEDYFYLETGRAAWGFGWFGSYCGEPPRYVVMNLRGGRGTLDVPYDGPTPTCPADPNATISSTLTDGPAGAPGSPVQPAPPSYLDLTTSARFLGATTHQQPAPVQVTITNTSAQPIELIPCPLYAVQTDDRNGKRVHFASEVIDGSTPGCKNSPVTVQPGQPLTFTVTRDELSPGTRFDAPKGSTFDVQVQLSGMPTAKASAIVQ